MKYKLNNKGLSVVELLITFSLIMAMVTAMLSIVLNYRSKVSINYTDLELTSQRDSLTKDIQDDLIKLGVKEITQDTCTGYKSCIKIKFKDNTEKILGVSGIDNSNKKDSIENKYIAYGEKNNVLKYEYTETLPPNITDTEARPITDYEAIRISNIFLTTDNVVLENGQIVYLYTINIYISHIDFEKEFGIHITTTTDDALNKYEG